MHNRRVVFADQVRGAILRTNPSVAYVVDQVPTAFNLVYCSECTHFKPCRVTYVCSNPYGLKNPAPTTFCPYGQLKDREEP